MCLSVLAITFELLKVGISFLVYTYILPISRSRLSSKVIGSRSTVFLDIFYVTEFYMFTFHSNMIKKTKVI